MAERFAEDDELSELPDELFGGDNGELCGIEFCTVCEACNESCNIIAALSNDDLRRGSVEVRPGSRCMSPEFIPPASGSVNVREFRSGDVGANCSEIGGDPLGLVPRWEIGGDPLG